LSKAAEEVVTDVAIAYTFIESEADSSHISEPPQTRNEIETALDWLAETSASVSARQVKGQPRWRLRGLGKRTIEVTTRREMLERDKDVVPMTAGVDLLQQLIERLELPSRVPLVLAQYSSGACRCVEARWVEADNVIVIKSAKQLIQLIHSWNGTLASPSLIVQAQDQARIVAQQRVERMLQSALTEEDANLRRQLEAARHRLIRELGRTLLCLGTGDLSRLFHEQVQREAHDDGRYHRALRRLNGLPLWTKAEIEEIEQFARSLTETERQARILGSEVDAALNDPRWRVTT
jgi:hypothetical protein